MSTLDHSSIFELFQQYKKFCFEQLADETLDLNVKIQFMTKVINELLEQNEHLLELVVEVQQSASNKSNQMHKLLEKTACKTNDVGLALSSYELELKKISEQCIPSFLDCANVIEKVSDYVETIENENLQLKKQNESFFYSIKNQSAELMQFKSITYDLMFSKSTGKFVTNFETHNYDYGFLELVLRNKLIEQEENTSVMVCASILDELITSIEVNNDDLQTNCSVENFNSNQFKHFNECFDINDNYDNENAQCNCNTLQISFKQSDFQTENNFFNPHALNLLSTLINELELKNSVIFDMRRHLVAIKEENFSLQTKYAQQGLQILSWFVNFKSLFDDSKEFLKMKSKLLREIDKEMNEILNCNEYISPRYSDIEISHSRFL